MIQENIPFNLHDAIINQINDSVLVIDAKSAEIVYVNPSACELLQYPDKKLLSRRAVDISLTIANMKSWQEHVQRIRSQKNLTHETFFKKRDGSIILVQVNSQYIIRDDKDYIICVARDITGSEQLRQSLLKSEERFKSLCKSAPIGIFLVDQSGDIIFVNRKLTEILELTAEKIRNQDWEELLHPLDRVEILYKIKQLRENNMDLRTPFRILLSSNRTKWLFIRTAPVLSTSGEVVGRVGTIEDITEQRKTERSLYSSEQQFRKIFEEGPIGMALVQMDTTIANINKRLCDMLGYNDREVIGKSFVDITHPEDIEKDMALSDQLFSGRIPFYRIDKRLVKKDSTAVWVSLTATVTHDEEGAPLYGLAMVQDISEYIQSREKLQEKNAALSALIEQIESEKKKIKDLVVENVDTLIKPMLTHLRKNVSPLNDQYIYRIEKNIDDLASDFGRKLLGKNSPLTAREVEISKLIKDGLSTKEIAEMLHLSVQTVSSHRRNIRKKLKLNNRKKALSVFLNKLNSE